MRPVSGDGVAASSSLEIEQRTQQLVQFVVRDPSLRSASFAVWTGDRLIGKKESVPKTAAICSMQSKMSSIKFYRTTSFPASFPTTTECPVGLHEIFDLTPNSHITEYGNREELPNLRVSLNLPGGVQDLKGLKRALGEYGLEVREEDDTLYVSGYLPWKDYNYNREIRATVAKYRRGSKSFSM